MFSRDLWKIARSEKLSLLATILFGVILGGFIVSQAWLLSSIIAGVFLQQNTLGEIRHALIGLLLIILGRGLATFGRERSAGGASINIRSNLRRTLFQHLHKVSPNEISAERTGELTATLIQGIDHLDAYFRIYLPQVFITAILPLIVLWVVFPIDWISGLVFVLTAPLIPVFMILIGRQADKETHKQWKMLGRLGGHFHDVLQGLKTLKAYGLSKSQSKVIRSVSDQYASVTLKVLRIAFLSGFVLEILATISTAVIAVQIGLRLLYGQIDFAESLFILILAPDFYFPFRQLGAAYHSGMEGIHSAERIFEITSLPTMPQTVSHTRHHYSDGWSFGPIEFQDVCFSYNQEELETLREINFHLPINATTALVGPTGAGKSTILSLILKFIQPSSGLITVAGNNLQDVESRWWWDQISWVPQFPYLFNDTVEANLLIAKPAASRQEIIEALRKANLLDFINSLPEGTATKIGEKGTRFSGGQAQRLAIARAYLKDAPFLILDEPTKNVDVESEEQIRESLHLLAARKTLLIVAHRLSSVRFADQIIVLDSGKVSQIGHHQDLLASDGVYRSLVYPVGKKT